MKWLLSLKKKKKILKIKELKIKLDEAKRQIRRMLKENMIYNKAAEIKYGVIPS